MSFWDCPILKAVVEVLVEFYVAWICATHEMASSWLLTPPPCAAPPPCAYRTDESSPSALPALSALTKSGSGNPASSRCIRVFALKRVSILRLDRVEKGTTFSSPISSMRARLAIMQSESD